MSRLPSKQVLQEMTDELEEFIREAHESTPRTWSPTYRTTAGFVTTAVLLVRLNQIRNELRTVNANLERTNELLDSIDTNTMP